MPNPRSLESAPTVRHMARVTPRQLAREFKRGLTMVGLARKYALTRRQVEAWIRSVSK